MSRTFECEFWVGTAEDKMQIDLNHYKCHYDMEQYGDDETFIGFTVVEFSGLVRYALAGFVHPSNIRQFVKELEKFESKGVRAYSFVSHENHSGEDCDECFMCEGDICETDDYVFFKFMGSRNSGEAMHRDCTETFIERLKNAIRRNNSDLIVDFL